MSAYPLTRLSRFLGHGVLSRAGIKAAITRSPISFQMKLSSILIVLAVAANASPTPARTLEPGYSWWHHPREGWVIMSDSDPTVFEKGWSKLTWWEKFWGLGPK